MLKSRGSQAMVQVPNLAYWLVLDIKFNRKPTLIALYFVYGCFLSTKAELSSGDGDWRPANPKIFIILPLKEKFANRYRMMQEWNTLSPLHHTLLVCVCLFFFNCVTKCCSIFQKSVKSPPVILLVFIEHSPEPLIFH